MRIGTIAKAITAGVATLVGVWVAATTDGIITNAEVGLLVTSALGVFGVWVVPNAAKD